MSAKKLSMRGPLPDFAAALFQQCDVAKFAASGPRGFCAGHAASDELVNFLVEMLFNLGGEIAIKTAARK